MRKHGWNLQSIAHAPPVGLEGQWEDCLLTFHLRLDVFVKHAERLELNNYCFILFQILLYYFKYCIVVLLLYCCIILNIVLFQIKLKKMVVEIKQPKINKCRVTYPQNKGHLSMCPQMSGPDGPSSQARADIRRKSRMRRQLVAI